MKFVKIRGNMYMNNLHNIYLEKFKTIKEIYQKYDFSTALKNIESDITDIMNFKVTVPLVGGFSTGKSSLINSIVNMELLSTDITPETAVPAEISYGNGSINYCMKDGTVSSCRISEMDSVKISANEVNLIKIHINNEFFAKIPDVKIVDMPGFDSGIEIHNRAINDYLPKSLAYIIAVESTEGTIRASILNFLAELKLNKMPVYIVITKSDKSDSEQIDEFITHIKKLVEQKMDIKNVKVAVTSADDDETDEIKEILLDIQKNSDNIFKDYYDRKLKSYISNLESYLKKQISLPDTNLVQIQEDKKLLEEKISEMQKELANEKNYFSSQAERCIEEIRSKVESELRKSTSVFENIVFQGGNIQEKVNFIVRNTITAGIRESLEPKLQKYISNVSDLISMGDIVSDCSSPLLDKSITDDNEAKRTALQSAVTPVATAIATVVGTLVGGPVGTVIGAITGAFLGSAVNKYSREQEENQKREAAAQRVNQIINEVMATVRPQIESVIHEMTARVDNDIDSAFSAKIEIKKKELNDLEANISRNEDEKQIKIDSYNNDLKLIESILAN
ncbi:MAG TPA: hypothetical protein DIW26_01165 [Ruminococcus sp.]|nr:hypothetical protein [Ruminococcus sp.]